MESGKIWFVTGASAGLGLALVKALLEQGHRVAATSRDVDALLEATGAALDGRLLPLAVDLGDERSVRRAVDAAHAAFGGLDVVVNNAACAARGPLDQLSDAALREGFDIGVFGAMNVIRAAMPRLRAQRGGHVFNVSSILGFDGAAEGLGAYCAAKFALGGLTEALAVEAAPHGVRVTLVYPGAARVPAQVARTLIQASQAQYAPRHLFLGRDAFDQARIKIQSVQQELARWREMSIAIGPLDERRLAA